MNQIFGEDIRLHSVNHWRTIVTATNETANKPRIMQTIKLSDLAPNTMLHKIATAMVAAHGEYFAMVDGKKTRIIK